MGMKEDRTRHRVDTWRCGLDRDKSGRVLSGHEDIVSARNGSEMEYDKSYKAGKDEERHSIESLCPNSWEQFRRVHSRLYTTPMQQLSGLCEVVRREMRHERRGMS